MNSLASGAGFLAAVGLLLLILRRLQTQLHLHPELARKLFHIGGGLLALLLPWVFHDPVPVVILSACSALTVLALKFVPRLRESLGRVTSSVNRVSLGEISFPVSVCFLFLASGGDPVFYSIPLLILTFADSTAALIGVRYGQVKYAATKSEKSVEGSAAFFLAGFFSVHVPLLLGTSIGRAESLLVALILAFLLVLLEAVSWSGLDNLFVPIVAFVLLRVLAKKPAEILILHLITTVTLTALVILWGRRTTLNPSGLLGGVLLCYAAWTIGGWPWAMVPALVFLVYPYLSPGSEWDHYRVHDVQVILLIFSAGLMWLILGYFLDKDLFYPFVVSFSAHLAIIGVVRQRLHQPGPGRRLLHAARAWAAIFAAYLSLRGVTPDSLLAALFALPCTLAAVAVISIQGTEQDRWRRQAIAAAAASVPALIVVVPLW